MRLYASNELKSRLTHAAANGSVIAADILSELKKNRPAQEIIRGSYSFLSTKRKWTDCGSFRKIRIVFTAFNKDPEHPNFPDRNNPQAPWFPENRTDLEPSTFIEQFKNLREYTSCEISYFRSAITLDNEAGDNYFFELDGLGQVVTEIGFDGLRRKYERDGAGRVTRVNRPGDKWTEYLYDGLDNILKEEQYDGEVSLYTYDKDGMLVKAENSENLLEFTRDRKTGQIIEEKQGEYTVNRTYDSEGNCTRITSSLGADIRHTYDREGNLQTMQAGESWQASWVRDNTGLEVQRTFFRRGDCQDGTRLLRQGDTQVGVVGRHGARCLPLPMGHRQPPALQGERADRYCHTLRLRPFRLPYPAGDYARFGNGCDLPCAGLRG